MINITITHLRIKSPLGNGNGRYISVSFIQVGPLGCFICISITTPIASALKNYWYYI
jgi:hypothetical protein